MLEVITPSPIVIKITDLDNNEHVLEAKKFRPKDIKAMQNFATSEGSDNYKIIVDQLNFIFEKSGDFFENFDVRVLVQALKIFTKEYQNPLAEKQNI